MKRMGILCALLSALIYGIAPVFGKMTFAWGNNSVNLTFWRATLSLPILLFLALRKGKISFSWQAAKDLLIAGGLQGLTALTLSGSYAYMAVGTATVLHFIYPLLVALLCAIFFKQRLGAKKIGALCVSVLGVAFFFDASNPGNTMGVLLAMTSGVTFAGCILWLNRPSLKEMPSFQFSLCISATVALIAGVFGACTGRITVTLPPAAWWIMVACSIATMVGALALFKLGVRWAGAVETSMISLIEPVATMVFGLIVLGDGLSWQKLIGCVIILGSLFYITLYEMRGRRVQAAGDTVAQ